MTGIENVREGHECPLPGLGVRGDVVRCSTCGRRWKFVKPGNPAYAGWRQTIASVLGWRR